MISLVQQSGEFTASPVSFTVTAGNTILVFVRAQSSSGVRDVVVSDADGTYARDEIIISTQHCSSVHRMNRSSGGARSITITLTAGSISGLGIWVMELSSRGAIYKDCGVFVVGSTSTSSSTGTTPVTAANSEFAVAMTHGAGNFGLTSITVGLTDPVWNQSSEKLSYIPGQPGEIDYKSLSAASVVSASWTWSGGVDPLSLLITYADSALEPLVMPPVGGGTTPTTAVVPCNPQSTTSNGGHGQAGCNTGGTGFNSSVTSADSVPIHNDPTDGESLVGATSVDLWMDLYHKDEDTSVTRYCRAIVPLGHAGTYEGGYKSPGLQAVGDVEYGISNEQGGNEAPTISLRYSDHVDRFIRGRLETEELEGDEIHVKLATPTAQAAASAPRVVMRGVIQETPALSSPLQATLAATDPIFSEYGPFGPERKWPPKVPAGIFATAPPDTLAMCLPWLYGEKSDEGATDPLTNASVSKGLMPLIYAGQMAFGVAPSAVVPTSQGSDDAGTVGNLGWGVGDGWTSDGTTDHDPYKWVYGVSGGIAHLIGGGRSSSASPSGTVYGFRTVWNATSVTYDYYIVFLVPSDYPTWEPYDNPAPSTANIRYKIAAAAPTNPFPDWQYIVYWHNANDGLQWGAAPAADLWDVYIAFGHPCYQITGLYGTDHGHGDPNATPDRVRIDLDARTDIRVPGYKNWTLPEDYVEVTDPTDGTTYWLTLVFVDPLSPLTVDHKAGRVTMAINAIGVMGNAGLPLIYAESCKHHWLENPILDGWTSGAWSTDVTFPEWQGGIPKVRSSTFSERHNYQVASLKTGEALRCGWYVNQQTSISDHIREWNKLESFIGYNSHGQFVFFGLDELADTSTWTRIRHSTDLFGPVRRTGGLQRENVVNGVCDWDPDFGLWRNAVVTLTDADAINRYKARRKEGDTVESKILNRQSDLSWVLARRLSRLKNGMTYIEVTGNVDLMDVEVGDGVVLESDDLPGGQTGQTFACYVMRKKLNLSQKPITVTLTLWDVSALVADFALPGGADQVFFVSDASGTTDLLVSDTDSAALAVLD